MAIHHNRKAAMPLMPFDIVAYTYKADEYPPNEIRGAIVGSSWEPNFPESDTETFLDALATHRGIDRQNEWSFDSDDFPKVIFRDQVE